jgi:hypothetical protein
MIQKISAIILAGLAWIALGAGLVTALRLVPLHDAAARAGGPTFWAAWFLVLGLLLVVALWRAAPATTWAICGALAWIVLFGGSTMVALLLFVVAVIVRFFGLNLRTIPSSLLWFIIGWSAQIVWMDALPRLLFKQSGVLVTASPIALGGRWILAVALSLAGLHRFVQMKRKT